MGWIKDTFERGDIANIFGGADKQEQDLIDKLDGRYRSEAPMGQTLAADPRGGGGQQAMAPQQQAPAMSAPARDMSGAGGNPFAQKAQQMGFSDYQSSPQGAPAMAGSAPRGGPTQQQRMAQALRGGGRYG